nr:MAG TPA: hypothetical protein [Herelleviridae sp.]
MTGCSKRTGRLFSELIPMWKSQMQNIFDRGFFKILFYLCFIKFYERTRETEELT